MNPVCDIQSLDTVAALHEWATTHHTPVTYLGPSLENQPIYGATNGHHTRVAVARAQPLPASADVAVPPGARVNSRWTAQPGVREHGPGSTITAPTRPTRPHRMCVLRPATTVVTSSQS